jgi:hypothetical protein
LQHIAEGKIDGAPLITLAPGMHHDLGVPLGIGELGERALHPVETDMAASRGKEL